MTRGLWRKTCASAWSLGTFRKRAVDLTMMRGVSFQMIPLPSSAWDVENETVWLTQAQLAELYKTSVQNVGHHIGNILEDEELQENATISKMEIVQLEGNRDGEPWFVAKNVCECMEIANVSQACQTLDEGEKGITKGYTLGGSADHVLN